MDLGAQLGELLPLALPLGSHLQNDVLSAHLSNDCVSDIDNNSTYYLFYYCMKQSDNPCKQLTELISSKYLLYSLFFEK